MTEDQVQSAVVRWLTSVSGVAAIKTFQGVTRPPVPYLAVEMISVTELSERPECFEGEVLDSVNSEGLQEIKVTPVLELEWVLFIHSYGEGQSSALRKAKQAAHLSQIQEPLGVLNIHETGIINSLPEFINNAWEPRSQMNLMIRGVTDNGFVIDTIEKHSAYITQRT